MVFGLPLSLEPSIEPHEEPSVSSRTDKATAVAQHSRILLTATKAEVSPRRHRQQHGPKLRRRVDRQHARQCGVPARIDKLPAPVLPNLKVEMRASVSAQRAAHTRRQRQRTPPEPADAKPNRNAVAAQGREQQQVLADAAVVRIARGDRNAVGDIADGGEEKWKQRVLR